MRMNEIYTEYRKRADILLLTKFDIPSNEMIYIKDSRIAQTPIAFYNGCKMYFDESSLPCSYSDITDLSNKFVLYGIFCNNKFYIGQTTDFGERMATHIKDSKKEKKHQTLYQNMRETQECVSFVFAVFNDYETLKKAEATIIADCKQFSIEKRCCNDKNKIKFIMESINDEREYAQTYCYNISK